jgi:hypothetical protein
MISNNLSLLAGNTLVLHYHFDDDTHTIDAFVQNKCECEFLCILREIADLLNTDTHIETEPFTEGGIRRWFKVVSREDDEKGAISAAIITSMLTTVIATPLSTSVGTAATKMAERVFEDKELKKLIKGKLKPDIETLFQDLKDKNLDLDQNNVIKKRKSNFYETLNKYPKVKKVSFVVTNSEKTPLIDEIVVYRKDFKGQILVSDTLEPITNNNAIIEIISPVLKKGKYKRWLGIYTGNPISFQMKSLEFNALVQKGDIQFKNGTSINCLLNIKRKIDNEGKERVIGYDVVRVNSYLENEIAVQTFEGKKQKQKNEVKAQQLDLFDMFS